MLLAPEVDGEIDRAEQYRAQRLPDPIRGIPIATASRPSYGCVRSEGFPYSSRMNRFRSSVESARHDPLL